MFDKWLARFRDPIEVELDTAGDRFYDERESEIAEAREHAQELYNKCKRALDELKAALDEMEGFEDMEGRQRFEDVMENIVSDRQRMLEETELPEEPADLYEELDEIIEAFQRMTRKESVILGYIDKEEKPAFQVLNQVEDRKEELGQFLDDGYQAMERYGRLKKLAERRPELKEKRKIKEMERENIDTVSPRKRRKEIEKRRKRLWKGDEWEEYQSLKQKRDRAEQNRRQVDQSISTAMRKMDRGLKKLLYEAEHGEVELSGGLSVLKDIRDRDRDAIMARDPEVVEEAVEAALDTMPDDLISDRQQEKFAEGAEELMELSQLQEELSELDSRISSLKKRIADHDAPKKERDLEDKIQELEAKIAEREAHKQELQNTIEQIEQEITGIEEEIESIYEDTFYRDVIIEKADDATEREEEGKDRYTEASTDAGTDAGVKADV